MLQLPAAWFCDGMAPPGCLLQLLVHEVEVHQGLLLLLLPVPLREGPARPAQRPQVEVLQQHAAVPCWEPQKTVSAATATGSPNLLTPGLDREDGPRDP